MCFFLSTCTNMIVQCFLIPVVILHLISHIFITSIVNMRLWFADSYHISLPAALIELPSLWSLKTTYSCYIHPYKSIISKFLTLDVNSLVIWPALKLTLLFWLVIWLIQPFFSSVLNRSRFKLLGFFFLGPLYSRLLGFPGL